MEMTLWYKDDEEEVGSLAANSFSLWSDMCEFDNYMRGIWKHGNGFDSADVAVDKIRERWLALWSRWVDAIS